MIGNQHTYVFFFQFNYNLLNVFHSNRINPCKRFVEQNKFWIDCKSPCNFSTSALTSRKLNSFTFSDVLKPKLFY